MSAEAASGPADPFYRDLMDKMAWVDDLHDKMEAVQADQDTVSLTESKGTGDEKPDKARVDT